VDIHELTGFELTLISARSETAGALRWLSGICGSPVAPGVGRIHEGRNEMLVLAIGPGRWLVRTEAVLDNNDSPPGAQRFDVSDVWRVFRLGNIAARRLLASGCPLDLDPRRFAPMSCGASRFDGFPVILCCVAPDTYEMFVEGSHAEDLRGQLVIRAAAMTLPVEIEP
jgi:sarcosine oxidase subunit gamma